jgi:predicted NBD/HSP70 family sugar kinase
VIELKANDTSNIERCAIGLDVGGTKIAGGVVTPAGVVRCKRVIATEPQRGGEAVLSRTVKLAEELLHEAATMGLKTDGVGLAVPELVDLEGNLTSSSTIDWRGITVRDRFSHLGPAWIEADSRAAALGEALFGAGLPFKLFFYVTVGTGIGSCLVQDRHPYAGARGSAGTLASSPLTSTCSKCGEIVTPVLEEIASGPALVKRYNQASGRRVLRSEDVLAAAAAGDATAIQVTASAGEALGATVGLLVNVLDPEAVIVGGGLGMADGLYWTRFVNSARNHIWSGTNRSLPILQAGCGVDAGLVGAAASVWRRPGRDSVEP